MTQNMEQQQRDHIGPTNTPCPGTYPGVYTVVPCPAALPFWALPPMLLPTPPVLVPMPPVPTPIPPFFLPTPPLLIPMPSVPGASPMRPQP